MIRLNCCIQARTGNGVATATIPLAKYQSRRVNYLKTFVFSSSEKGFGDAATERRSGGAKKVRTLCFFLSCSRACWKSFV